MLTKLSTVSVRFFCKLFTEVKASFKPNLAAPYAKEFPIDSPTLPPLIAALTPALTVEPNIFAAVLLKSAI